eukprot:Selendium_serpulae@DN5747_c0_g1_i1.p1
MRKVRTDRSLVVRSSVSFQVCRSLVGPIGRNLLSDVSIHLPTLHRVASIKISPVLQHHANDLDQQSLETSLQNALMRMQAMLVAPPVDKHTAELMENDAAPFEVTISTWQHIPRNGCRHVPSLTSHTSGPSRCKDPRKALANQIEGQILLASLTEAQQETVNLLLCQWVGRDETLGLHQGQDTIHGTTKPESRRRCVASATTKQNPSSRYPMSPQYLCCYRYGFLQVGLPMTDLFSGTKIGSLILQFWQTNGMICSLPRTACLNNKRFDFKKKKKKKKKKKVLCVDTN